MRHILIVMALLSFSFAHAQDDDFKNIIQLSSGLALPMGDFASTHSNDGPSGAQTGVSIDIIWQHKIKNSKGFGYAVQNRNQSFAFNPDAVPGYTVNSSTDWTNHCFMIGPVYSIALSKKVFFEPRIMIGLMLANSPKVEISNAALKSASATCFTNSIGANFRFDAWNRVSLFANFDYQSAKAKFNIEVTGSGGSGTVDANQKMDSFNIAGGVGYRF